MKGNLLKTMLVGVCLLTGTSGVSAYDIPDGLEIKNVFLGTLGEDGKSVTAEDFESATGTTPWDITQLTSASIASVTEVAKPEVGSAPDGVPTYVSGNTFQGKIRQSTRNGERYATYSFNAVSTGKVVFSGDFFSSGDVTSYPIKLRFMDSEGNPVLTLNYNNGSGSRYYQYTVGDGSAVNTSVQSVYQTYLGFGIKDLVVDFASGDASFTLDYINNSGVRAKTEVSLNIGKGKNIAQLQIGKDSEGSNNVLFYLDNAELYTVGTVSSTYNYSIVAKDGDTEIKTLKSGTCKGGVNYSISELSKVIENDGKFYVLNDENVSKYGVTYTYTMGEADETQIINYTLDESIIYFDDAANAPNPSKDSQASGGNIGWWGSNKNVASISDLNVGAYEVTIYVWKKGSSGFRGESIAVNDVVTNTTKSETGEQIFIIPVTTENSTMKIYGNSGSGNATDYIDYILVRKLSELPVEVGKTGYATLAPSCGLDFSKAKNVKAYIATSIGSDNVITLKNVSSVAAGEGVLIYAEGGASEDIAVDVNATANTDDNMFVGVLEDTYITTGYILYVVNDEVGFYTANATANDGKGTKVPAGKAYLPKTSNAKSLKMIFEDDVNGISEINAVKTIENSAIYNINGQRVMKPTKGLYIMNGKKFIIK